MNLTFSAATSVPPRSSSPLLQLLQSSRRVSDAELKIKNAQARRTVSLPTSSKEGSSSASAFDLDFGMNE
ncbi:hypothetical protein Pyn_29202 [Prunus yedoensis var. nudiflora]|uniref:Uncharacterized protein n=1 Tax=Prunus yedoensis var. nudiflora TaxID=2094558 RepID=A0A314XNP7_PRUYE|nr:hypothetical protein Pyn_31679 [Prunus yedoensis var. nudiflora]PQQ01059.1 hypothetical protein Pyn_29202 [Prunus yedoensis var. nudiflora]